MSTLYDHLPPWKRPVVYNDPPERELPERTPDVLDDDPRAIEEFGVDDDDDEDGPADDFDDDHRD